MLYQMIMFALIVGFVVAYSLDVALDGLSKSRLLSVRTIAGKKKLEAMIRINNDPYIHVYIFVSIPVYIHGEHHTTLNYNVWHCIALYHNGLHYTPCK